MTQAATRAPAPLLVLLSLAAFPCLVPALPPDDAPPAAAPVQLPYATRDDAGTVLHVNADGSLNDGQGDLFDAGAQLFVGNNFQYAPDIPQAAFDARRGELLFPPMPASGLSVSRRVAVDARAGWWRYVETFENPGQAAVRTQVRVRFDLCGAVQNVEHVADERRDGRPLGVAVFDGDDGIAILGAGRGPARSAARPQFNVEPGGDSVDVVYDVEVPARKTVSIVHVVAVRPGANEAANFLRSVKDADVLRGLPPEVLRTLGNFSVADRLIGDVEILRGELFDVVELRGGDVYKGTLREKAYQVQTPYGLVELPAERVVAMVTLGQYKPTQLVVTADGEVFGGTLKAETVRLELSGGHVTAVPLASVRRLGYRRRPGEAEELHPPPGRALVMLRAGDRIAVEPPQSPLVVATCYGTLKLDPRSVASVAFQSDSHGVHEIRLVDGSRFAGVVAQERFDLLRAGTSANAGPVPAGGNNGRSVSFAASSLRRLQLAPDVEAPPSDGPQLSLSNGDVLAGGLRGRVVLETAFDAIELEAEGLQGVRQGSSDAGGTSTGEVQLTLWDGATLSGRVRGDAVDCVLGCGASVRVPVAMVKEYTQPRPRPAPQVVERIKAVVADLNADDWKARDRAAAQLGSIGPAAAGVLKELRGGQPPEVRQRIDQILAAFDPGPQNNTPPAVPQPRPAPEGVPVDVPEGVEVVPEERG